MVVQKDKGVELEDVDEEAEKGKKEVSLSKIQKLRITFPQVHPDDELISSKLVS